MSSSVFVTTNHLFLRHPNGGVEDVAAMKAAGFGAIFCNVGDFEPSDWLLIRERARDAGVVCGPWLRTTDGSGRFSLERLERLLLVADAWGSPLIVNAESELKASGDRLTRLIDEKLAGRDGAVSMETWPFDDVDWTPLARRPLLPQLFRAIVSFGEDEVRSIWHRYGVRCVVMTCGGFGGSIPGDYTRRAPFGVYAADDLGQRYSEWGPVGTVEPCEREETPMDGRGAARSASDAWDAWLESKAKPEAWRADNPGEWKALQDYAAAEPGTEAPTVRTATGRMLLAILEARRWADGTHA